MDIHPCNETTAVCVCTCVGENSCLRGGGGAAGWRVRKDKEKQEERLLTDVSELLEV